MKEKSGGLITRGADTIRLAMTNKIVVSVSFLIQGVYRLLVPQRVMNWEAKVISLILALYALVSLILVLTNSPRSVKHQEIAGGFVKDLYLKKKRTADKEQELLPENSAAKDNANESNKHRSAFENRMIQKHEKTKSVSRIVMLIFYAVVLSISVFMLFNNAIAVHVNHILVGLILIVDAVLSIISFTSAKDMVHYKNYKLSIALAVFTVILGLLFIVSPAKTSIVVMRIIGATLILKSIADLIIAFRNREILSSAKDTFEQIKERHTKKHKKKKKK